MPQNANEFHRAAKALSKVANDPGSVELVEGLADVWVRESKRLVPVDTGQTKARTNIVSIRGGKSLASADVQSDTPYAGFVEYGTRYVAPRPYFRAGRDAAAKAAADLGGPIETQIRRVLDSGGVWNPRKLF